MKLCLGSGECAVYDKMTNQCAEQVEMDVYVIKDPKSVSVCLSVISQLKLHHCLKLIKFYCFLFNIYTFR